MTIRPFSAIRQFITGAGEVSVPVLNDFVDSVAALSSGGTTYSAAISAATGSDQSTASALAGSFSVITTGVANAGVLLAPLPGQLQIITNATVSPKVVYPSPGMAIGSLSSGAGVSLGAGLSVGVITINNSQAYLIFNSSSFG